MDRCLSCGQPKNLAEMDWQDFSLELRMAMARANMSFRDVQKESGVDQATIHRAAKHGQAISVANFLLLLDFCSRHPSPPEKDKG